MKKPVLFIVALLSFGMLNAQLPFTLGLKAGFTTSKLSTDKEEIKEDFKANFQGGVFLRLGTKTHLQPEANFVTKGGLLNRENVIGNEEIRFSTLEIPILLGREVIDLKLAKIRVMAGPTMSFVLDQKIDIREDIGGLKKEEISNKLEDALWGIQAGVGVDVLMLTLDVRYEWGLNDLIADPEITMRNSMFNVSVGWKIF